MMVDSVRSDRVAIDDAHRFPFLLLSFLHSERMTLSIYNGGHATAYLGRNGMESLGRFTQLPQPSPNLSRAAVVSNF